MHSYVSITSVRCKAALEAQDYQLNERFRNFEAKYSKNKRNIGLLTDLHMVIYLNLALFSLVTFALVSEGAHAQYSPQEIRSYEKLREWLFRFADNRASPERHLAALRNKHKLQSDVPERFPCAEAAAAQWRRSPQRPSSAHRLRPGDIDVVAAMGDSLTSGYGNTALMVVHVLLENRGWSFSGGGEGTWREFLTLPNILKEFNANLTGYATRDSLSHERASRFNVAEGAALSRDMALQARNLVKRMRTDPRVDIHNHWKMVTLMIGSNDICTFLCYEDDMNATVERHGEDLQLALDFLQASLPRTIVNLVITPDLKEVKEIKHLPPQCFTTQTLECVCLFGHRYEARRPLVLELIKQWQIEEHRVGNSGRYRKKEDFVVLVQPFLEFPILPKEGNNVDLSFFSEDCFHLSQKGSALFANGLWMNLMESDGQKSTSTPVRPFSNFPCPSEDRPFISTWGNNGGRDTTNDAG